MQLKGVLWVNRYVRDIQKDADNVHSLRSYYLGISIGDIKGSFRAQNAAEIAAPEEKDAKNLRMHAMEILKLRSEIGALKRYIVVVKSEDGGLKVELKRERQGSGFNAKLDMLLATATPKIGLRSRYPFSTSRRLL